MSTPIASVKVTLDKAQAERDAQSFGQQVKDALVPVIDVGDLATSAFNNVKAAIAGMLNYMREGVVAAAEDAAAEARLAQALRVRGMAVEGVVESLVNYNQVMMQTTGLSDASLLSLQTQLIALGVHRDKLQEATTAAIGLSQVTGKDLVASGTAVARILEGTLTPVTRLGIQVTSTAEAIEFLTSRASLAGSELKTFSGQWALLGENLGQVQEAIGDPVARSAGVIGALGALNEMARGTQTIIGDVGEAANKAAGGDALGTLAAAAREMARTQFPTLVSAGESVVAMLRSVGQEANDAAQRAANIARVLGVGGDAPAAGAGENDDGAGATGQKLSRADILGRIGRRRGGGGRAAAEFDADQEGALDAVRRDVEERGRIRASLAEAAADAEVAVEEGKQRRMLEAQTRGNEVRFQAELAAYDRREQQRTEELVQVATFARMGADAIGSFAGTLGAALGRAAATGQDAGDALLGVLGGIVSQIGGALIGLGTAAVAGGTLGTIVPFLAPATGGPLGIAAGLAAIGVGTALTAGGAFISASISGGGGSTNGGGNTRTPSPPRTLADQPQNAGARGGDRNATFVVQVTGGVWGMDSPRALRDLLDQDARRRPVRRGAS
jgi:hypothetical protein